MRQPRVAVLGAGIMGSSVALFLARGGARVSLFDSAAAPFSGASRWNEGKIHLGYLYAGDRSLETARGVLPGGLTFKPLTEELLGCSIAPAVTAEDDIYLVHRDSVATVDQTRAYFEAVTALAREHPGAGDYLVDLGQSRALSPAELDEITDPRVVRAGFRVPERSVSTGWIADRFLQALEAENGIEMRMGCRVGAVEPVGGKWSIHGSDRPHRGRLQQAGFDFVVNALWHGRIEVDRTVGLEPEPGWSHRYRLSLFVRTGQTVQAPSAVLATGPFGDMKNYTGRDFYLSWYRAGLMAEGEEVAPPPIPPMDAAGRRATIAAVTEHLGNLLPAARRVMDEAVEVRVEGGWVFAKGKGSLADPAATVHRRDRFGIGQVGSYFSVDTGKYSAAPLLARQIADRILGLF